MPDQLETEGSDAPSSGSVNLLESHIQLRELFAYIRKFNIKGILKDTVNILVKEYIGPDLKESWAQELLSPQNLAASSSAGK